MSLGFLSVFFSSINRFAWMRDETSILLLILTGLFGFLWIGSIGMLALFGVYRILHRRYLSGWLHLSLGVFIIGIMMVLGMVV